MNERNRSLLWITGLGAAGWLVHALHYRFLQDDAFIFFRYAENIAQGHGPVWNPGEPVEGYTSPAWLALLSVIQLMPLEVETGAHASTLALGAATLVIAFHLASAIADSRWAGCATVLLLATDRTFAVWSTSGMETRLYGTAALFTSALVWRRLAGRTAGVEAALLGPALLLLSFSRPEGLMWSGLTLAVVWLRHGGPANTVRSIATATAVWVTGVAAHVAWRWSYYDRLLPNTFYAKVSGLEIAAGASYLYDFILSYPVFFFAVEGAFIIQLIREIETRTLGFAAYGSAIAIAFSGYLLAIGGGFMEYRMLDALILHGQVLIGVTLVDLGGQFQGTRGRLGLIGLTAGLGIAALVCGQRFELSRHRVMPRSWMWELSTREWVVVGQWLGEIALPGESLATTAAGAIPYYAKLPSIDMLGLNDRRIADGPDKTGGGGVGHRKLAEDAYLEERGVTYVVGHPMLYDRPELTKIDPGDFFVRVENRDPQVREGRDFFVALRTTGDTDSLIDSLRRRGVAVLGPRRER